MSTVLYLDTTTNRLMLGLSRDGVMVQQQALPCESHRYHSAMLVPAIEVMLDQAGLSVKSLTALALNVGPGSFTGLRTGVVTVRTMAQFLDLPVYGLNTFELLAFGHEGPVAVYLDALRNRAYHAVLSHTPVGPVYEQDPVLKALDPQSPEQPDAETILVSPALQPCFTGQEPQPVDPDFCSPEAMRAMIQGKRYPKPCTWQEVRPLYLQEPSITLRKNK